MAEVKVGDMLYWWENGELMETMQPTPCIVTYVTHQTKFHVTAFHHNGAVASYKDMHLVATGGNPVPDAPYRFVTLPSEYVPPVTIEGELDADSIDDSE